MTIFRTNQKVAKNTSQGWFDVFCFTILHESIQWYIVDDIDIQMNFIKHQHDSPYNHRFEKENHFPNLHSWVQDVNFQGVNGIRHEPIQWLLVRLGRTSVVSKKNAAVRPCQMVPRDLTVLIVVVFCGHFWWLVPSREHRVMKVWFRWIVFANGWFLQ